MCLIYYSDERAITVLMRVEPNMPWESNYVNKESYLMHKISEVSQRFNRGYDLGSSSSKLKMTTLALSKSP